MKKLLSFLLVLCLMLTAVPMCVSAETGDGITLSADVERTLYCPGDTVSVNIDLTNNASGIAMFRGKLYYDSANLTFKEVVSDTTVSATNNSAIDITKPDQSGYVQILWDTANIVNYYESDTIATVLFTVNEDAANKNYDFTFEYMDGVRYIVGNKFAVTDWEYVNGVVTVPDSMTVVTEIPNKLYFENVPTGAYPGETVTLDIAFSGEGLYTFNSKLHYDTANYEFVSCEIDNPALNLQSNNEDGYVNLLWDSKTTANYSDTAVIASVTFKVKETASEDTSRFELEYVDAVSIDFSNGVDEKTDYFNAFFCEFPLLTGEKVLVNITLNRGNGASETVVRYAGETLILPDTGFVDKNWYTDPSASVESIYNETICPSEGTVLYSSAVAVDYSGNDEIVPYRYSQDFSVVKENDIETLHFASCGESEYARMFRLSKVEDNVTYKLTIKYKADVESKLGFGVAGANGNNMSVNTSYFEGDASTSIYSITADTEGYKTADIYFTASLKGTVENPSVSDDIKSVNGNDWAYLTLIDGASASNKIWISELTLTKIGEVISVCGASLLNDSGYTAADNKQAIRYFFSYDTVNIDDENLNIVIGDKNYKIVARGFLYRNGAVDKYVNENLVTKEGMNYTAANNTEIITKIKNEEFNQCWEYNNKSGKLCFSTYISGYTEEMYDYKLMVRGFVTFSDEAGNKFTVYSSTINRSVNGMMNNPLSGVDAL